MTDAAPSGSPLAPDIHNHNTVVKKNPYNMFRNVYIVGVFISHHRALHDAFEVDEVQVIGCSGAGCAVTHCVHHLGYCNTHGEQRGRHNEREEMRNWMM